MAYYNYTSEDVRAQAGSLALQMFDLMARVGQFKAWLDATPDADIVAKGLTQSEVTNIKSAFTDLAVVRSVFLGTASATQADRSVFAGRLLGPATY